VTVLNAEIAGSNPTLGVSSFSFAAYRDGHRNDAPRQRWPTEITAIPVSTGDLWLQET